MSFRNLQTVIRALDYSVTAQDITGISYPVGLAHNWRRPYFLSSAFQTDVVAGAYDSAEERTALRSRPVRSSKSLHTAIGREAVWALRAYSEGLSSGLPLPVPIYSDQATVKSLGGGFFRVNEDLTLRRFFVGQVLVLTDPRGASLYNATVDSNVSSVYCVVTNILGDAISYSGATGAITTGMYVFPCFQALARTSSESVGEDLSPLVSSLELTCKESVAAGSVLPPVQQDYDLTPYGFDTGPSVLGPLPVLQGEHNWRSTVRARSERPVEQYLSGRSTLARVRGEHSFAETIETGHLDRASFWRILRFFESRLGRTRPFWYVPDRLLLPRLASFSAGQTTLTFDRIGYHSAVASRLDGLYFVLPSGATSLQEIVSVSPVSADSIEVVVDPGMPAGLDTSASRIYPAFYARLSSDVLDEEWETTSIVQAKLSVEQLHNLQTIEIP